MTPRSAITLAFAAFMTALVSGCGTSNPQAPALDASNRHPAGWVTAHRAAYFASPNQCRSCHGNDLKGGITKVDCFNQAGDTRCHANGHGPRSIIHPLPFSDPALHGVLARKDLTICQDCHGTSGGAGSNPRFNVRIGGLASGCESSGCHAANMAHPKPWKAHLSAGNLANACALCHGASFGGGSGPACSSCHTSLAAGIVPVNGACVSCHGTPPGGNSTPNRAGAHAVHLALPEVSGNCAVCHSGGGSAAANHGTTLTVALPAVWNAKSGSASYNSTSKSCANVKCHGGQATPAWYGGTISVAGACASCHVSGATQFNGYVSGRHATHISLGLACSDCHDMSAATAPSHFSNLSSVSFRQLPVSTIRSYVRYTAPSCSPQSPVPAGNQIGACHGTRAWP